MMTKGGTFYEPVTPCMWCGHHDTSHTDIRRPSEFGACHVGGCPCGGFDAKPTVEELLAEEGVSA